MLKSITILLLELGAAVAGNLLAGYIQQDVWPRTPARLVGMAIGAVLMLILIVLLESERNLAWNWRWHRLWYLRELAKDTELKRWETDFARLKMAHGRNPPATAELLSDDGRRRDMVALLYEMVLDGADGKRRALVLGEPGAGKTTGLERLTWELARRGARRLGWRWRIPVLLRLGNYHDGKLADFAADEMRHAAGGRSSKILSRGLADLMEKGHVVLLCDALDEALGERRDLVLAQIDRLLTSRQYDKTPVVITARTREDPGNRLDKLTPYTIQDLNDAAVGAFVHTYRREGDDPVDVLARLKGAGLLEPNGLGRNPFWLKLVVESGVFQKRKGRILRQSVETLLEREWDKPATQRAGWNRVLAKEVQIEETRAALAWLAYRMSEEGVVTVEQADAINRIASKWLAGRSGAGDLQATDIVGLGRDAQLLVYWPGPLRFRHRLLQEYLTADYLAADRARWEAAVAPHASETGWWETLLMLGHLVADPNGLARAVLDDGQDVQRIFLAFGILQGSDAPAPGLNQSIGAALGQSLSGGVTDAHRTAVGALARIMRADVVALLTQMVQVGSGPRRDAAVALLLELDERDAVSAILSRMLQDGERDAVSAILSRMLQDGQRDAVSAILSRMLQDGERDAVGAILSRMLQDTDASQQWVVLTFLAASADSGLQDTVLATAPAARRTLYELALAQLAAPQPGAGMVERGGLLLPDIVWGGAVPAGNYTVGGDKDAYNSFNKRQVPIPDAYQLARYPVTYAQFQCFVAAPDFADARWWEGMHEEEEAYGTTYRLRELSEQAFKFWDHPREWVSWYQAIAFCRWLSDKLGYAVDLPHEYEWEVAARYPDGRFYPYGSTFDKSKANTREGGPGLTSPVGAYPAGANEALNLHDMSGNVWEWCRNKYNKPDEAWAGKDAADRSSARRVVRGGSWSSAQIFARAAYRNRNHPLNRTSLSASGWCAVPHLKTTDRCRRASGAEHGPRAARNARPRA